MTRSLDPDEHCEKRLDSEALDKTLTRLQDCDLSEWDQDFVDDLTDRLDKYGARITLTPLQQEQIERMRKQYHVE